MKAYVCFKCGFSTTIKNRFDNCPICNGNFAELSRKENKTFLNLNGEQKIKWIENKIGHSIQSELNTKRENYKTQKIIEVQEQDKTKPSTEFNAKMEHGKAVLEEASRRVTCSYCGSSNVKKITVTNKAVHTSIFGIWSMGRNAKNYHCNNCGSDF